VPDVGSEGVVGSTPEQYLVSLSQIRDVAQQRAFISNNPLPSPSELLDSLTNRIVELLPRDPELAEVFAETAQYIAQLLGTSLASAQAIRAKAQVLYNKKRSADAHPLFEQAVELFNSAGADREVGRTLVVQMENLSFLSRYEEAIRLEPRARAALEKAGDTRYLCVLEIVLGNFHHRLDHFTESLSHYDAARRITDDPFQIAAIGMNRASTLTDMNRFDEAIESFEDTKHYCEKQGLHLWVDIADRELARMNFHRGNYSTALRLLEQVRGKHLIANDTRRIALCDRDRAEIYLQLNLFEDASNLARNAHELFARLGNRYEAAMCLTFLAIAEFKMMRDSEAQSAFLAARGIFEKDGNATWSALVDVWRAQLLIRQQQFSEAQELARNSAEVFEKQQVPVRAANARVLSAQSWQELDNPAFALEEAEKALEELEGFHAPWVSYQCYNTLGRLKELDGAIEPAEELYLKAISEMELLRGNIRLDELQMSFGKDKYQVYENMVNLQLKKGDLFSGFDFVERSKSRTLIDLLERNLDTVWDASAEESPRLQRIRKVREELNILYSRLNEVGASAAAGASDAATKDEISHRERELVELLRGLGSEKSGWATLQSMKLASAKDVQGILAKDEALIEYYMIGGQYLAFVITPDELHILRDLASVTDVRESLKGLNFQLTKFHLQNAYLDRHAPKLLEAAQFHLRNLYRQLMEKVEPLVRGRALAIVPHHILHYIPFHALFDGESYLIDRHDIVYGASASVIRICREKNVPKRSEDLVLAVADELTPFINEEVEALRELLPKARFFTGKEAREDKLKQYGPAAGKLHIAAHGIFRSDNPMFSSLRLGESWLNLFDIFNLQLGAELTTLSACETGMSAVWEGDELLGLARGFLYAGTPSLVVSLWTVNDRSTAQLMRRFYMSLNSDLNKAHALREAMLEVKSHFPHPFYWAPFVLMGKS
jgi:CHAT domain-containing protein